MSQSTSHKDGFVNDHKIPTGREGDNVPDDFYIPPAGIEDADRAVYDMFDSQIPFQVVQRGKQGALTQPTRGATEAVVKVPVIFATGERFAHVKKLLPFRDDNNTIILPLISIGRKSLEIGTPQIMPGITHRGVSDFVPDLALTTLHNHHAPVPGNGVDKPLGAPACSEGVGG